MAVLTFEQVYEVAAPVEADDQWKVVKLPISLPYTASWENTDGQDGLIQDGDNFYNIVSQRYVNDTLYTTLKTNQNAKERFFELAEQWQQLSDDQTPPKSPLSQLLKMLKHRLNTYLPPFVWELQHPIAITIDRQAGFGELTLLYYGVDLSRTSPPPKQ
ncbi:hypothetical protein GCM10027577_13560 [Spirosoma fluminis]